MIRGMFTVAAAMSLLLCISTCVLSVRSEEVAYAYDFDAGSARLAIGIARGQFFYDRTAFVSGKPMMSRRPGFYAMRLGPAPQVNFAPPSWSFVGITKSHARLLSFDVFDVRISSWLIAMTWAVLPILWIALRFRRRSPAGMCSDCGYDLRASTDRCPECGTRIPSKQFSDIVSN